MQHGVVSRSLFDLGGNQFWIDLQDNSYYGERKALYFVPSRLNNDCWGIDFSRQFKTEENCRKYMTKCIFITCKQILKDID